MNTEGTRRRVGIHESKGIRRTEKAADREAGSVAYFSSGRAYNDDARANFKEAYRSRSSPARNILSASLAFHAGHQTLLLPATKRFTLFSVRSLAAPLPATQRKTDGEREKKNEPPAEEPFPVEIHVAGNSAISHDTLSICPDGVHRMLRLPFPALFLSPVCCISRITESQIDRFPDYHLFPGYVSRRDTL